MTLAVIGFLLGFGLSELLFEINGIPILKHLSYKEKIENKTDKALKKKNKYLYSYIRFRIEKEAKKGHTSADIGTLFTIDCDGYDISPKEVELFCEINGFGYVKERVNNLGIIEYNIITWG